MAAFDSSGPEPTGLVLAGGGARGAYEAGALSVLLPVLERSGKRPSILNRDERGRDQRWIPGKRPAHRRRRGVGRLGRALVRGSKGRVVRPILTRQAPLAVLRYAGEILSLPHVRLLSSATVISAGARDLRNGSRSGWFGFL